MIKCTEQTTLTAHYHLIVKKFFLFACGAFCTRSISLLMAPITMQLLTPADYGLLSLLNSFIAITTALIGLGLRQMLVLHYFACSTDKRIELIADILTLYVVTSTPVLILLYYCYPSLNHYLFFDTISAAQLLISLIIIYIYFFVELLYQLLQYHQQTMELTLLQMSITLITISCNVYFLYVLKLGVYSILAGQAIGMLCILTVGVIRFFQRNYIQYVTITRTFRVAKQYMCMGLPFVPSMLSGVLFSSGDRWIIAQQCSLDDLGIYAVAQTVAQLLQMIVLYAFTGSYLPYMLNRFATSHDNLYALEAENKRIMWTAMIISFCIITIGTMICTPVLYWCMPPLFHRSIAYIYPLTLSVILLLGTQFLNCFIQYQKRAIFLGAILCAPTALHLILCLLLTPYMGLYGLVVATLTSYSIYFFITYWYNNSLINQLHTL